MNAGILRIANSSTIDEPARWKRHWRRITTSLLAVLGIASNVAWAQPLDFEVISPLRAHSVLLLRINLPQNASGGAILIEAAPLGQKLEPVRTVTRRDDWFYLDPSKSETARTVLLPIAGSFTPLGIRCLFESPGIYDFRCTYAPTYPNLDPATYTVATLRIVLETPAKADLALFEYCQRLEIADAIGLTRQQVQELREQGRFVASELMGMIIRSLQSTPAQTEHPEWAEVLDGIAIAESESSFAPYFALCASVAYLHGTNLAHFKRLGYSLPDSNIVNDERYAKSRRSLEFAASHGDDYVKPIAASLLAGLKAIAGELSSAEKAVAELSVSRDCWHIKTYIHEAEVVIQRMKAER